MIKKILLAIFQVLLSTILLLLILEGACWMLGFPQGASDFIERVNLKQHLTYRKPKGQIRVFVYGESTVHGAGYAPTSSPVKWLEVYLKDFLPGRDIKVMNYGRLGEESEFIAQSFLDTLQYKPDLAIFYLGHNTFYPDNRVAIVRRNEAQPAHRLKKWFCKSRLISAVIRETIKLKLRRQAKKSEDTMGDARIETIAIPFAEGNENITPPGSAVFLENVSFLKGNVERIARAGNRYHVPVVFMKPVCNLKDYPPAYSIHMKSLSPEDLKQWNAHFLNGKEASSKKDDLLALEYFEKAFAIDATYAELPFFMGKIYFQNGELDKARVFFELSRDNDVVIRRAPRAILQVFDDLQKQGVIRYFDTDKALSPHAPGGILGRPLIEDNVHFSVEAQAFVARALADEIANNPWIAPRAEWRLDRERPVETIAKEMGITQETIFGNYCSVISYLGIRYDERLEFARRAYALFPENPIALRQLAWGYWLTGDKAKALEIYRLLAKKDPAALEAAFNAQPELRKAYDAPASVQTAPQ